jgi:SusD family.
LKEDDGSVTWNRYCTPTKELVAKFDKENDVRFKSSILWRAVPYNTYWPADNYPLSYKIREKSSDIILMRFADIMLLKAEALIELGNIKEAVIIINDIRRRAGLGSSLIDENINQEKARKVVLDERQLELYMEGQRWFDLKRNNLFIEVMKEQKMLMVNTYIKIFRSLEIYGHYLKLK